MLGTTLRLNKLIENLFWFTSVHLPGSIASTNCSSSLSLEKEFALSKEISLSCDKTSAILTVPVVFVLFLTITLSFFEKYFVKISIKLSELKCKKIGVKNRF